MIAANIAFSASVDRDVLAAVRRIDQGFRSLPDAKEIRVTADVTGALADIAAVRSALGTLPASREVTVRVRYVTEGTPPEGGARVTAARAALGGDPGNAAEMTRLLNEQADAADRAAAALGAYSALRGRMRISDATIDSVGRLTAALNDLNAASAGAAVPLAVASALRGSGGSQAASAAAAAAIGSALAGAGTGGQAGSGATAAAVAAALGAAGGPGGGGGAGGGFVPWAGGGWPAVRFWGMMAAEISSTFIPALVAAGSAALVGAQGFEQLRTRAQAVYTVSEALGPALNQSLGGFLAGGKYGNALQAAQTAAEGGVYGLAGAGIALVQSGTGQGLIGQGTSALAMLDRAAAATVLNMTGGGKGQRITDLLGGGTGYLRQFGDIGANLGNVLLNLGPDLPGVGAGLLSGLTGATGALSAVTGGLPGPALQGFLSYEALSRWGPALLGGQGLIGRMLGLKGIGGLGGLIGRAGEGIAARGLGGALGDVGLGIAGFGDALGAATGPEVAVPGAELMLEWSLLNKGWNSQAALQTVAGLQQQVAGAGFTGAWQPLGQAITKVTGLAAATAAPPGFEDGVSPMVRGSRFGAVEEGLYRQAHGTYVQAGAGFTAQFSDLLKSGPQLMGLMHDAKLSTVSMADAFQIAQNSLVNLSGAFDSTGKFTGTARQQIIDYLKVIGPMTQSGGAFGAAVAGQQVMSSGQMKNLQQVNQAMDAMTQIMSGGPAGEATLAGMLGGSPVTTRRGGYTLNAPPAYSQMAQDLTSFTSASGSAAWRSFAGPQGLISAEQSNLDQLRTALTLGALTQPQAAGLAGYQIQQLLPLAQKSPAALAMLMQQGKQMGIGSYYDPSRSQAANYRSMVSGLARTAYTPGQVTAATTQETTGLANIPSVAQQFSQSLAAQVASQQVASAGAAFLQLQGSVKGTSFSKGALSQLITQMQGAGLAGGGTITSVLNSLLSKGGISQAAIKAIDVQVKADTSQAAAKINALKAKPVTVDIKESGARNVQAAIDAIRGRTILVTVKESLQYAAATRGPLVPGAQSGGLVPGSGSGDIVPEMLEPGEAVVPRHLVPLLSPFLAAHKVPGFGASYMGITGHFAAGGVVGPPAGGAAIPGAVIAATAAEFMRAIEDALRNARITQAAGELAGKLAAAAGKPSHAQQFTVSLVSGITGSLKNLPGGIQGVAEGLLKKLQQEIAFAKQVQSAAMPQLAGMPLTASSGSVGDQMKSYLGDVRQFTADLKTLSAQGLNKQILQQLISAGPQIGGQLAESILHGAKAQIASGLTGGLNIAGMNVDPATGQGSVGDQMQSYAASMKAFQGDLTRLQKGGLNKDILQQILGAGPTQGDALAQSILGSSGGVGQANSLWKQIQQTANQIGAQFGGSAGTAMINKVWQQLTGATQGLGLAAASGMYGGNLTTQSGTITNNNVSVNIFAPPGTNLTDLSAADLKKLLGEIEAALNKKAKKNPKTPVKTTSRGRGNS